MLIIEKSNGALVSNKILKYDSFFKRAAGLMFKKKLEGFDGILLLPCSAIHTFFMKINIDCFFLDRDNKIIKIIWRMEPSKISGIVKGCNSVLELASGTVKKDLLSEGDALIIKPAKN